MVHYFLVNYLYSILSFNGALISSISIPSNIRFNPFIECEIGKIIDFSNIEQLKCINIHFNKFYKNAVITIPANLLTNI